MMSCIGADLCEAPPPPLSISHLAKVGAGAVAALTGPPVPEGLHGEEEEWVGAEGAALRRKRGEMKRQGRARATLTPRHNSARQPQSLSRGPAHAPVPTLCPRHTRGRKQAHTDNPSGVDNAPLVHRPAPPLAQRHLLTQQKWAALHLDRPRTPPALALARAVAADPAPSPAPATPTSTRRARRVLLLPGSPRTLLHAPLLGRGLGQAKVVAAPAPPLDHRLFPRPGLLLPALARHCLHLRRHRPVRDPGSPWPPGLARPVVQPSPERALRPNQLHLGPATRL